MNPSQAPEKGDVLKLGPPASGDVIITVDPGASGTTFAAGTETLLPGAEIPVHKHLEQDEMLFIHKGQGRVTLNERTIVVVHGAMLYVPRGTWHGVRNTGNGTLHMAWASAPPGMEAWFRDLARAGTSPATQLLQELAQRHRIEFRQPTDAPMPAHPRHRRRRGGRWHRSGHRGPARPDVAGPAVMPSSTTSGAPVVRPAPSTVPPAPAASSVPRGHRRRRHRRRGGRGAGSRPQALPTAAPQAHREQSAGTSAVPPPSPQGSPRPGTGRPRSSRPPHRRRVREVYMGGRWVQIEGEGPVIAPGPQQSRRRSPKPGEDDEPPATRLSVPL